MTGGGFVEGADRTSFGFIVRSTEERQHIQFQLQAGDDRFHASELLTFNVVGDQATWTATGEWNGVGGYRLTVTVTDRGSPSAAIRDSIEIQVQAPGGSMVYQATGSLEGGNIVIH